MTYYHKLWSLWSFHLVKIKLAPAVILIVSNRLVPWNGKFFSIWWWQRWPSSKKSSRSSILVTQWESLGHVGVNHLSPSWCVGKNQQRRHCLACHYNIGDIVGCVRNRQQGFRSQVRVAAPGMVECLADTFQVCPGWNIGSHGNLPDHMEGLWSRRGTSSLSSSCASNTFHQQVTSSAFHSCSHWASGRP